MIPELIVGTVLAIVGIPTLYVTLKASAMALRGEKIGEPKSHAFCVECKYYSSWTQLYYSDGLPAGHHSWCALRKAEDPIRSVNKAHNCSYWCEKVEGEKAEGEKAEGEKAEGEKQ